MITRFISFFRSKGMGVLILHVGFGSALTLIISLVGFWFDKIQALGGYGARILHWQSYLLWIVVRSNFIERYDDGSPIYAGLPFMIVWLLGLVSGIPIYTSISMLVHYIFAAEAE